MGDEPRNAAVEAFEGVFEDLLGAEHLERWSELFAEDLIVEDRRRIIALPDQDKAACVSDH